MDWVSWPVLLWQYRARNDSCVADALTDQLASAAAEAWRVGDSSSHTTVGAIALIHLLNPKGVGVL
eukprot:1149565-Pelagomonas_calceolata.AAC.1